MRGSRLGSAEICQILRVDLFLLTTLSELSACVRACLCVCVCGVHVRPQRTGGLIMERWCVCACETCKGQARRLFCSNPSWPPAQQASRHRGKERGAEPSISLLHMKRKKKTVEAAKRNLSFVRYSLTLDSGDVSSLITHVTAPEFHTLAFAACVQLSRENVSSIHRCVFYFIFFFVFRGGNDTDTIAGCETEGARDTVDRDGWMDE